MYHNFFTVHPVSHNFLRGRVGVRAQNELHLSHGVLQGSPLSPSGGLTVTRNSKFMAVFPLNAAPLALHSRQSHYLTPLRKRGFAAKFGV